MIADLSQLNVASTWDDATAAAAWVEEQDQDAASWLHARHDSLVRQIVGARVAGLGLTADVSQEVWVSAFRALARYDGKRPFASWLARIAINACHDALRADRRCRVKAVAELPDFALAPSADAGCLAGERALGVQRLLAILGADAEVVWSFHGEGHSAAELGPRFHLTEGGVRLRVCRALKTLRRSAHLLG